jgi:hypothetical protein
MYEQRNFAIFSTTELDQINFNEVLETSADTVRKSVDGTKIAVVNTHLVALKEGPRFPGSVEI